MDNFIIGICDDNENDRNSVRQLCERFFKENDMNCSFVFFSSGEEVLEYEKERMNLLFLDIEMNGIDGIQVIRKIEQSEIMWRVVFVTSHQESVFDSFGIKTLGFERKPVDYEQIKKWLQILVEEYRDNLVIEYIGVEGRATLELENICYIEAQRNYVNLHVREGDKKKEVLASGNLKSWEEKLEETYVIRIHKTYLINLIYVSSIGKEIVMKDGTKIPIGRQYKEIVSRKYCEYICRMADRRI